MANTLALTYGCGWSFPPVFSIENGISMAEGEQDVIQSLHILFSTLPGERIMRPDYGCDIQEFMFKNIREELITQITTLISDSILRYEQRVELDSLDIVKDKQSPNRLSVLVNYYLRGSNIAQQINGNINIGDGILESFA